jgi:hypothetical protein
MERILFSSLSAHTELEALVPSLVASANELGSPRIALDEAGTVDGTGRLQHEFAGLRQHGPLLDRAAVESGCDTQPHIGLQGISGQPFAFRVRGSQHDLGARVTILSQISQDRNRVHALLPFDQGYRFTKGSRSGRAVVRLRGDTRQSGRQQGEQQEDYVGNLIQGRH